MKAKVIKTIVKNSEPITQAELDLNDAIHEVEINGGRIQETQQSMITSLGKTTIITTLFYTT